MPLWLTEQDVRAVLSLPELIGAMESALAAFSTGKVDQPVRTAIEVHDRTFFASMPAYDGVHGILGAKLVTVFPENSARGMHTHLAAISLFDAETGELTAVMDGRYITEVRTAAASAVSVRHLAREDATTLAILGSGVQARSHLQALQLVRPFKEIRAWSPTPDHLREFAVGPVQAASSAAEAVTGADAVLIATNSVTPTINDAWVKDGAHVIAIGACRPSQREIDPALVARAALFVDSRAAAVKESGDVIPHGGNHIRAELGEVIYGQKPGRRSADEVTLYKSLGLAIEDLTAAALVYRRARGTGPGLNGESLMTAAERDLQGFIDKFTPEIAALARACLKKMRARFPYAAQLVYDNYNALAIGFGPSDRASEAIFSIVLYPRWVTLFLLQGAGMPDPDKLLKGSGKVVRHIVLESAADLDNPAIQKLMTVALNRAKAPMDPTARGSLEIRSVAAKQRPRRP